MLDGRVTGFMDTRLETYRHNQDRIPSIAGRVIPERAFTEHQYGQKIFDRIRADIAPHDPQGILDVLFLNSRGAIARFDRHAIEIRLIDIQECPQADMAVAEAIIAAIRLLTDEATIPLAEQQEWPEDLLADIFLRVVREGEQAVIGDADYLAALGIRERRASAGSVWRTLAEKNTHRIAPEYRPALRRILTEGTLARRLVLRLGSRPGPDALTAVYRELAACLAENRLWP